MTKPRVFIVQKQLRQTAEGELVPKFDLSSGNLYGEPIYLLGPTAGPFNHRSVIAELQQKLTDYSSRDFLLLVGNPCLIGWATAIAAQASGGELRLLQWSGKEQKYLPIRCSLGSTSYNAAQK